MTANSDQDRIRMDPRSFGFLNPNPYRIEVKNWIQICIETSADVKNTECTNSRQTVTYTALHCSIGKPRYEYRSQEGLNVRNADTNSFKLVLISKSKCKFISGSGFWRKNKVVSMRIRILSASFSS